MELILIILIFSPLLIYQIVLQPRIIRKKINEHINSLGGEVDDIEKLSIRPIMYYVHYTLNGKMEKVVVQFDFFCEDTWRK